LEAPCLRTASSIKARRGDVNRERLRLQIQVS